MNDHIYSVIRKEKLMSTGLISKSNEDLLEFLSVNEVNTIGEFLDMIDTNTFKKITYNDILLEAIGLADLIKLKYFNIPLEVTSYLHSIVSESTFNIYGEDFIFLAVTGLNGKKVNIYSALTRLGFNDKERQLILDYKLEGNLLLDIFEGILNEIVVDENIDNVLRSKLELIVGFYKKRVSNQDVIGNIIASKLNQLASLLDTKGEIEQKIEELCDEISILDNGTKGKNK